jgi:hypothetical protein
LSAFSTKVRMASRSVERPMRGELEGEEVADDAMEVVAAAEHRRRDRPRA